eukprot:scaffold200527_cov40-Cyclotella_meneghiniana.AAC.1
MGITDHFEYSDKPSKEDPFIDLKRGLGQMSPNGSRPVSCVHDRDAGSSRAAADPRVMASPANLPN